MTLMFATARVTVTVEVDAATWDISSSAEQIFNSAGTEALQRLENVFKAHRGIRVIGEPSVVLITGVRKV
jgi:hypothetical protein